MKKKPTHSFSKLSNTGKLKKILEWLDIKNDFIVLILSGECIINYDIIQEKLDCLCDSFMADEIDFSLSEQYFEPKGLCNF